MDDILKAIDDALKREQLSASAASQLAVGNPAWIKNLKNRRGQTQAHPIENLQRLAEVLRLEFYFGEPRASLSQPPPPSAPEQDFAHIPLHAAFLAAGGGAHNGSEEVIDYLAFRRDWMRKVGINPANAALARISGDSMQPSIWAGDMVMIDRSRIEVPIRQRSGETRSRSPVYALLDDGMARVKRIERPNADQLILMSDNPQYAPKITSPASVRIIGKVVWWGHTAET